MKVISSKNPRMANPTEAQLDTLEKAVQTVDRNLFISEVDFEKGTVSLGMVYNPGEPSQWKQEDFLVVNVACDSVAALFHDVYSKAYDRCI